MTRVLRLVTCGGSSALSGAKTGWLAERGTDFRRRKRDRKESKVGIKIFVTEFVKQTLTISVLEMRLGQVGREVHLIANREIQHIVGAHCHRADGSTLEWIGFARIARDLILQLERTR